MTQRPTTREERKAKQPATLPARFVPRFWEEVADKRQVAFREIRRRYELLHDDIGEASYQKELLAQRAVFIAIQLETMEANAIDGKEIALGSYTQLVNCLQGLLRALGLERQMKNVGGLEAYLKQKERA